MRAQSLDPTRDREVLEAQMTGTGKRQDSLVTAAHPSAMGAGRSAVTYIKGIDPDEDAYLVRQEEQRVAMDADHEMLPPSQTQKNATASQDNDVLPSAGTPADAVSPDMLQLQHNLVKSVLPAGAFVTDDHRYYFNGEGPKPSVTTVLEILDKPALSTWKAQKAAGAMYRAFKDAAPVDGHFIGTKDESEAVKWALAEVRKTRTDAAAVGSGVHHLADMALRASVSDPNAWQVDEGTQPYIDAYRAFSERYMPSSFISSEKAVWSLNGYGGTYDLLMMLPCDDCRKDQSPNSEGTCVAKELWLIDIKTGKGLYPEFALQLAGYRWADYIILPGDPTTYDMPHVDRTGVLHLRPDQYPQGYRLWEYPTSYETDYMTFLGLLEAYKWRQSQSKPISHKD